MTTLSFPSFLNPKFASVLGKEDKICLFLQSLSLSPTTKNMPFPNAKAVIGPFVSSTAQSTEVNITEKRWNQLWDHRTGFQEEHQRTIGFIHHDSHPSANLQFDLQIKPGLLLEETFPTSQSSVNHSHFQPLTLTHGHFLSEDMTVSYLTHSKSGRTRRTNIDRSVCAVLQRLRADGECTVVMKLWCKHWVPGAVRLGGSWRYNSLPEVVRVITFKHGKCLPDRCQDELKL